MSTLNTFVADVPLVYEIRMFTFSFTSHHYVFCLFQVYVYVYILLPPRNSTLFHHFFPTAVPFPPLPSVKNDT